MCAWQLSSRMRQGANRYALAVVRISHAVQPTPTIRQNTASIRANLPVFLDVTAARIARPINNCYATHTPLLPILTFFSSTYYELENSGPSIGHIRLRRKPVDFAIEGMTDALVRCHQPTNPPSIIDKMIEFRRSAGEAGGHWYSVLCIGLRILRPRPELSSVCEGACRELMSV